jgi:hypothetical protein
LIAMGILYSIPLPVFRAGLHTTTVVVVGGHSKRINRLKLRDSVSGARSCSTRCLLNAVIGKIVEAPDLIS